MIRVILQSRLSSSRLPGKALLPVANIPSAVLCALRAMNTGLEVIVATSLDVSDDTLCRTLEQYQIQYYRGSLNNTLERFCMASSDMLDSDYIVRITADNLLVDGSFIQDLINVTVNSKLEYAIIGSQAQGYPYGLCCEAFTVAKLRERSLSNPSAGEREHVTLGMKSCAQPIEKLHPSVDAGHLRCTMDTFTDYCNNIKLFSCFEDPIAVSWFDLYKKLVDFNSNVEPVKRLESSDTPWRGKIALGMAQIGIDGYGRMNQSKKIDDLAAIDLIDYAIRAGISTFDTANAYNTSEARLGRALKYLKRDDVLFITKLSPLAALPEDASKDLIYNAVDLSVYQSLYNLNVKCLPVLMLHRWEHYKSHSGLIWQRLLELQNAGLIAELGASVYTVEAALECIENPAIKHIQVPYNILDTRLDNSEFIQKRKVRTDVTIHARSIFLQGILLHPAEHWPQTSANAHALVAKLDHFCNEFGFDDKKSLCISHVLSQDWIDYLVLGVDNIDQLKQNIALSHTRALTSQQMDRIRVEFSDVATELLDPSQWIIL